MKDLTFLSDENQELLVKHERFRSQLYERPASIHSLFSKCKIRALVVADSFLYFNDENFGLSDFVDIVGASFSPYATVELRRAHRGNPGASRLNGADANFTFSDATLANVDVLFLFAAATRFAAALPPAEVDAIARFMDAGGGVFATGDHEDLGVAMCGEIPRVRSMRKWYWPQSAATAAGQPVAPDGGSASRHDTNREGHDAGFSFDDQSDDVPQKIKPRYYSSGFFKRRPHALLCGPDGKINILPDHPHEGECIAVASAGEFPEGADGHREWPEVIATSTMIPGAETAGKPPVPGGSFGAIGAYNGHRSDVGRVATDATWHHFININLTGTSSRPPAHPKSEGFLATPIGQARLEKIKAYYRNLAVWLAPRAIQRCIAFRKLLAQIVLTATVREELQSLRLGDADRHQLLGLGRSIVSIFRLNTEICEELAIEVLLPSFVTEAWRELIPRPLPQPDPPPFTVSEEIVLASLAGSALQLRDAVDKLGDDKKYSAALEQKLMKEAEAGAAKAVVQVLDDIHQDLRSVHTTLEGIGKGCAAAR